MKERIRNRIQNVNRWVRESQEQSMGPWKVIWVRIVRFFVLLGHMFTEDRLLQRASSLTYTTILSIFPLLAVITALGSVFTGGAAGLEEGMIQYVEQMIMPPTTSPVEGWLNPTEEVEAQQKRENLQDLTNSIRQMFSSFRENAAGIGFLGFLGVLIAAGLLYSSVEKAFNEIWNVYDKGSILRTLTTFTTLIVCTPLLIGMSVTFSVTFLQSGKAQKEAISVEQPAPPASTIEGEVLLKEGDAAVSESPAFENVDRLSPSDLPAIGESDAMTSPVILSGTVVTPRKGNIFTRLLSAALPPIINGIFLALAYMLVPRAKVSFRNALLGGLAAGFIWEAAKIAFGYYVFSSTVRNALFRSLGAVPIFLIWIYFTWVVFLAGNEIVYILQNYRVLRRERFARPSYTTLDSKLIFGVALLIADAFETNSGGTTYDDLKAALGLRDKELQNALTLLRKKGFIVRTEEKKYTMTRPAHNISVTEVLQLGCNVPKLFHTPDNEGTRVEAVLEDLQNSLEAWQSNKTLHEVMETLSALKKKREAST